MSFWSFKNDPTEMQDFIISNPLCPQKLISTQIPAAVAELLQDTCCAFRVVSDKIQCAACKPP